jgi:hypothetical protein
MELAIAATDKDSANSRVLPSGRVIIGMAFLMTKRVVPERLLPARLNNS